MARSLRVEYPNAVYHVTARGNGGNAIYLADSEREAFLDIVSDVRQDFNWLIYAYCLMGNHYHLLLETPDANLSEGMRRINSSYAQRFNRIRGISGHLFQGRFKSVLVEKENHLLEVCRYIALNPVRAGIVKEPSQWRWSSYRVTAGIEAETGLVDTVWILSQFGVEITEARQSYCRFVLDGVGAESPWKSLKGGLILGSDKYAQTIRPYLEKITLPTKTQKNNLRPGLDDIFADADDISVRNRTIYRACCEYGYLQREVAEHLGLSYVSVSRIISKLKMLKVKD